MYNKIHGVIGYKKINFKCMHFLLHKKRGIITVGKVWDFYGKQFLEISLNYKQEIFAKN